MIMKRFVVVIASACVACVFGCVKPSDRIGEGEGEGEGEGDIASPCDGAALFVQTDNSNDTADAALVVDGGEDLVLFGPTADGASFETLQGHFAVGGYAPNQTVHAQVVTNVCALEGCPTTVGFRFFDTINVTNTDGCGARDVQADATGTLLFRATGGGTGTGTGTGGGGGGGGGGANGPDTGLRLTPQ